MSPAAAGTKVEVEGKQLSLSNLGKVLYPETGFTKGQVIDYYRAIAPAAVPHLEGRPLTLKRYPNGVDQQFFYEKRCPSHRPPWVEVTPVYVSERKGEIPFCVCNDLATLIWVANLASLELHTSLSRAADIKTPTMLVFDLDPGPPATIVECSRVALRLRQLFDQMHLACFAKTSGSKGMQLYIPLNTPTSYERGTKSFALAVAQMFGQRFPDEVVAQMRKEIRPGKVFIDWSQNDEHKTTVCVYSLRARERPTVSTPVTWDEVADCADTGDGDLLVFEAPDTVARFNDHGDLFAPLNQLEQELPHLAPS